MADWEYERENRSSDFCSIIFYVVDQSLFESELTGEFDSNDISFVIF